MDIIEKGRNAGYSGNLHTPDGKDSVPAARAYQLGVHFDCETHDWSVSEGMISPTYCVLLSAENAEVAASIMEKLRL